MLPLTEDQTQQIMDLLAPLGANVIPEDFKRDHLVRLTDDWHTTTCSPLPGVDLPPFLNIFLPEVPAFEDIDKKRAVHPLGMRGYFVTDGWAILPALRSIPTVDVQCAPDTSFENLLLAVDMARVDLEVTCRDMLARLLQHDLAVLAPIAPLWWPGLKENEPHQVGAMFVCAAASITSPDLVKVPFFRIPVATPRGSGFGNLFVNDFLNFRHYD